MDACSLWKFGNYVNGCRALFLVLPVFWSGLILIQSIKECSQPMRTYETLYIKVYRTEKQYVFVILSKIGPPLKISSPPFFEWRCCKGWFSLISMPTYSCHSIAVMLGKKYQRSSTVQEEGLQIKADTINCYCISKCITWEALQNHCMLT